jgi:hypothetical protein
MINHQSAVNLNLHPRIEVIVVVMHLPVLAIQTIALFRALLSSPEALAIVFAALWFFASAPPHRHKGGDALKSTRVAEVCHLLGFVYLHLAFRLVAAADA